MTQIRRKLSARLSLQQHANIDLADLTGPSLLQEFDGNVELDPEADLLLCFGTGTCTLTLPPIAKAIRSKRYVLKQVGAGGKITITPTSPDLIDGQTSINTTGNHDTIVIAAVVAQRFNFAEWVVLAGRFS